VEVVLVTRKKTWFLPETPDVLGMLRDQTAVTIEGLQALADWAAGAPAGDTVREAEHRADAAKRALWLTLRTAFSTPLGAEDLFTMSALLDAVLNQGKDAVREAEVMAVDPDPPLAEMAGLIAQGVAHLDEAFERFGVRNDGDPTEAADAAVKCQRQVERVYRRAMSDLVGSDDVREVNARRELYRRFSRMSDTVEAVAERVWYAVVKEG
jgi:uncharacterized protein